MDPQDFASRPTYNRDLEEAVRYSDELRQSGQSLPMEVAAGVNTNPTQSDVENSDDVLAYWEQNSDKLLDYNHPDAYKVWEKITAAHKNRVDDLLGMFAEGAKGIAGLPADIVEGMVERPNPLVWATSTAEGVGRMARDMYGMFVHSQNPDSPFFWAKSHIQAVLNGKPSKNWKEEVEQWNQTRTYLHHSARVQAGDDSVFKYYFNLSEENNKRINSFVDQKVAHGMAFLGLEIPALLESGFTAGASQALAMEAMGASANALRVAQMGKKATSLGHTFQNAALKLEQFASDVSRVAVGSTLKATGRALEIPAGVVGNLVGGTIDSVAQASGLTRNAIVSNAISGAEAIGASEIRQTVGFFGSLGLRTSSELMQEIGTEMVNAGKGIVGVDKISSLTTLERVAQKTNLSASAANAAKFASVIIDPMVSVSTSALKRGYRNAVEFGLLGYGNDKGRGAASGAGMGFVWGGYSGAVRGVWSKFSGEFSHTNLKESFDAAIPEIAKINPDLATGALRLTQLVDAKNSTAASNQVRAFFTGLIQIAGKEHVQKMSFWAPNDIGELTQLVMRDFPEFKNNPVFAFEYAKSLLSDNGLFFPNGKKPIIYVNTILPTETTKGHGGTGRVIEGFHEGWGHFSNWVLREKGMIGEHLRQYHGTNETNGAGGTDAQKAERAARLYAYTVAADHAIALWEKGNPDRPWEKLTDKEKIEFVNKVAEQHYNLDSIDLPTVDLQGNEINTKNAFSGVKMENGFLVPNGRGRQNQIVYGGLKYFQQAYKQLRLSGDSNVFNTHSNVGTDKAGNPVHLPSMESIGTAYEFGDPKFRTDGKAVPFYGDALRWAYEEAVGGALERIAMFNNMENFLLKESEQPLRMHFEAKRKERYARMLTDIELAGIRARHGEFAGINPEGEIANIAKFEAYDNGQYRMDPEMDGFVRNLVRAAIDIDEGGISMLRPDKAAVEAKAYGKEFLFNFGNNGATLKGTKQLNEEATQRAEKAMEIISSEENPNNKLDIEVDEHGNRSVDILKANDATLDKLAVANVLDAESVKTVKAIRDAIKEWERTGFSTPNVFTAFYWGDSHRVKRGNILRRLRGEDVPVTHRVFVPFEVKLVHRTKDANGKAYTTPKGGLTATVIDYMAIHRRKLKMWSRPDVQRMFNNIEHFNKTFDKYLINMMQDSATRVPSADLFRSEFGPKAEQVRDMMYETFGARKRNDEAYANVPREGYNSNPENPDYPIHSMKLEMMVGAELTATAPFPYHHGNSYPPLRVNKSIGGFVADSKQFERYSDRLGYSILNTGNKYAVFDPFGAKVGVFESIKRAITAANKNAKKLDSADLFPMAREVETLESRAKREGEQPVRIDNYALRQLSQYSDYSLKSIAGVRSNWRSEWKSSQEILAVIDKAIKGEEIRITDLLTPNSIDSLTNFTKSERTFDLSKMRIIDSSRAPKEQYTAPRHFVAMDNMFDKIGRVGVIVPSLYSGELQLRIDFDAIRGMSGDRASVLTNTVLQESQRVIKAFREDAKYNSFFCTPIEFISTQGSNYPALAHRFVGAAIRDVISGKKNRGPQMEQIRQEFLKNFSHLDTFSRIAEESATIEELEYKLRTISRSSEDAKYAVGGKGWDIESNIKGSGPTPLLWILKNAKMNGENVDFSSLKEFLKLNGQIKRLLERGDFVGTEGVGPVVRISQLEAEYRNQGTTTERQAKKYVPQESPLHGTFGFSKEQYLEVRRISSALDRLLANDKSGVLGMLGREFNHTFFQYLPLGSEARISVPVHESVALGEAHRPRINHAFYSPEFALEALAPKENSPIFVVSLGSTGLGTSTTTSMATGRGIIVNLSDVRSRSLSRLLIQNEGGARPENRQNLDINRAQTIGDSAFPINVHDAMVTDVALNRVIPKAYIDRGAHLKQMVHLTAHVLGRDIPELAEILKNIQENTPESRMAAADALRYVGVSSGKTALIGSSGACYALELANNQSKRAQQLIESRISDVTSRYGNDNISNVPSGVPPEMNRFASKGIDVNALYDLRERFKDEAQANWLLSLQDFWGIADDIRDETKFEKTINSTGLQGGKDFAVDLNDSAQIARSLRTFHLSEMSNIASSTESPMMRSIGSPRVLGSSDKVREMMDAGLVKNYYIGGKQLTLFEFSDKEASILADRVSGDVSLLPFANEQDPATAKQDYIDIMAKMYSKDTSVDERSRLYSLLESKFNANNRASATRLGQIFDHPLLYKYYPELRDANVRWVPTATSSIVFQRNGDFAINLGILPLIASEVFTQAEGFPMLSDKRYIQSKSPSISPLAKTILHEAQHFIQVRENMVLIENRLLKTAQSGVAEHIFPNLAGVKGSGLERESFLKKSSEGAGWKYQMLVEESIKKSPIYDSLPVDAIESIKILRDVGDSPLFRSLDGHYKPILSKLCESLAVYGELMGKPVEGVDAYGVSIEDAAPRLRQLPDKFKMCISDSDYMALGAEILDLREELKVHDNFFFIQKGDSSLEIAFSALGLHSTLNGMRSEYSREALVAKLKDAVSKYSYIEYLLSPAELMARETERRAKLSESELMSLPREDSGDAKFGSIIDRVQRAFEQSSIVDKNSWLEADNPYYDPSVKIMKSIGGIKGDASDNLAVETLGKMSLVRYTAAKASEELRVLSRFGMGVSGWEVGEDGRLTLVQGHYVMKGDFDKLPKVPDYKTVSGGLEVGGAVSGSNRTYTVADICALADLVVESENVFRVNNSVIDLINTDSFPQIVSVGEIKNELSKCGAWTKDAADACRLDSLLANLKADEVITKNDLLNMLCFLHKNYDTGAMVGGAGLGTPRQIPIASLNPSQSAKIAAISVTKLGQGALRDYFGNDELISTQSASFKYGRFVLDGSVIKFRIPDIEGVDRVVLDDLTARINSSDYFKKIRMSYTEGERNLANNVVGDLSERLIRKSVLINNVLEGAFEKLVAVAADKKGSREYTAVVTALMSEIEKNAIKVLAAFQQEDVFTGGRNLSDQFLPARIAGDLMSPNQSIVETGIKRMGGSPIEFPTISGNNKRANAGGWAAATRPNNLQSYFVGPLRARMFGMIDAFDENSSMSLSTTVNQNRRIASSNNAELPGYSNEILPENLNRENFEQQVRSRIGTGTDADAATLAEVFYSTKTRYQEIQDVSANVIEAINRSLRGDYSWVTEDIVPSETATVLKTMSNDMLIDFKEKVEESARRYNSAENIFAALSKVFYEEKDDLNTLPEQKAASMQILAKHGFALFEPSTIYASTDSPKTVGTFGASSSVSVPLIVSKGVVKIKSAHDITTSILLNGFWGDIGEQNSPSSEGVVETANTFLSGLKLHTPAAEDFVYVGNSTSPVTGTIGGSIILTHSNLVQAALNDNVMTVQEYLSNQNRATYAGTEMQAPHNAVEVFDGLGGHLKIEGGGAHISAQSLGAAFAMPIILHHRTGFSGIENGKFVLKGSRSLEPLRLLTEKIKNSTKEDVANFSGDMSDMAGFINQMAEQLTAEEINQIAAEVCSTLNMDTAATLLGVMSLSKRIESEVNGQVRPLFDSNNNKGIVYNINVGVAGGSHLQLGGHGTTGEEGAMGIGGYSAFHEGFKRAMKKPSFWHGVLQGAKALHETERHPPRSNSEVWDHEIPYYTRTTRDRGSRTKIFIRRVLGDRNSASHGHPNTYKYLHVKGVESGESTSDMIDRHMEHFIYDMKGRQRGQLTKSRLFRYRYDNESVTGISASEVSGKEDLLSFAESVADERTPAYVTRTTDGALVDPNVLHSSSSMTPELAAVSAKTTTENNVIEVPFRKDAMSADVRRQLMVTQLANSARMLGANRTAVQGAVWSSVNVPSIMSIGGDPSTRAWAASDVFSQTLHGAVNGRHTLGENEVPRIGFAWKRLPSGEIMLNFSPSIDAPMRTDLALGQPRPQMGIPIRRAIGWDHSRSELIPQSIWRTSKNLHTVRNKGGSLKDNFTNLLMLHRFNEEQLRQHEAAYRAILDDGMAGYTTSSLFTERSGDGSFINQQLFDRGYDDFVRRVRNGDPVLSSDKNWIRLSDQNAGDYHPSRYGDALIKMSNPNMSYVTVILPKDAKVEDIHSAMAAHMVNFLGSYAPFKTEVIGAGDGKNLINDGYIATRNWVGTNFGTDDAFVQYGKIRKGMHDGTTPSQSGVSTPEQIFDVERAVKSQNTTSMLSYYQMLWRNLYVTMPHLLADLSTLHERVSSSDGGYFMPDVERRIATNGDRAFAIKHTLPNRPDLMKYAWDDRSRNSVDVFKKTGGGYIVAWNVITGVDGNGHPVKVRRSQSFANESLANSFADGVCANSCEAEAANVMRTAGNQRIQEITADPNLNSDITMGVKPSESASDPNVPNIAHTGKYIVGNFDFSFPTEQDAKKFQKAISKPVVMSSDVPQGGSVTLKSVGGIKKMLESDDPRWYDYNLRREIGFGNSSPIDFVSKAVKAVVSGTDKHKRFKDAMTGEEWHDFMVHNGVTKAELRTTGLTDMLFRNRTIPMNRAEVARHLYAMYPRTGRSRWGHWNEANSALENNGTNPAEGPVRFPLYISPTQLSMAASKRVFKSISYNLGQLGRIEREAADPSAIKIVSDKYRQSIETTFRSTLEDIIGKEMAEKVMENTDAVRVLENATANASLGNDVGIMSAALLETFRSRLNKELMNGTHESMAQLTGVDPRMPDFYSSDGVGEATEASGLASLNRLEAPAVEGSANMGVYLNQSGSFGAPVFDSRNYGSISLAGKDTNLRGFQGFTSGSNYDGYASGNGPYWMDVIYGELAGRNKEAGQAYLDSLVIKADEAKQSGDTVAAEKYKNMIASVSAVMRIRESMRHFSLAGGGHKSSPDQTIQVAHIRSTMGVATKVMPIGASNAELANALLGGVDAMVPVNFIEEIQSDVFQGRQVGTPNEKLFLPSDFRQAEASVKLADVLTLENKIASLTSKSKGLFEKVAERISGTSAHSKYRDYLGFVALDYIIKNSNPIQRYALAKHLESNMRRSYSSGTFDDVVTDTGRRISLSKEMAAKYGVPEQLPVYEFKLKSADYDVQSNHPYMGYFSSLYHTANAVSHTFATDVKILDTLYPGITSGNRTIPNMEHINPKSGFIPDHIRGIGDNVMHAMFLGMMHDENFAANAHVIVKDRDVGSVNTPSVRINYDFDALAQRIINDFKLKVKAAEIAIGATNEQTIMTRDFVSYLEHSMTADGNPIVGMVGNEGNWNTNERTYVRHDQYLLQDADWDRTKFVYTIPFRGLQDFSNVSTYHVAMTPVEAFRYVYSVGKRDGIWADTADAAEQMTNKMDVPEIVKNIKAILDGQPYDKIAFVNAFQSRDARFMHFNKYLYGSDADMDQTTISYGPFPDYAYKAVNHGAKTPLGRILEMRARDAATIIATGVDRAEIPSLQKQVDELKAQIGESKVVINPQAKIPDVAPFGEENSYRPIAVYQAVMRALESNQRGIAIADGRHHRARYSGGELNAANFVKMKTRNGLVYVPIDYSRDKGNQMAYFVNYAQSVGAHGKLFERLMNENLLEGSRGSNNFAFEHNGFNGTLAQHIHIAVKESLADYFETSQSGNTQSHSVVGNLERSSASLARYITEGLESANNLGVTESYFSNLETLQKFFSHSGVEYADDAAGRVMKVYPKSKEFMLTFPNGVNWGYAVNYGMPLHFNMVQMAGMGLEAQIRMAHDAYQVPVVEMKDGKYNILDSKTGKLLIGGIESVEELHERKAQLSKYLGSVASVGIFHKMFGKAGGYAMDSFLLGPSKTNDGLGESAYGKRLTEQIGGMPYGALVAQKLTPMIDAAGGMNLNKKLKSMSPEQAASFIKDCFVGDPEKGTYNAGRRSMQTVVGQAVPSGITDAYLHASGIRGNSTPEEIAAAIMKGTSFTAPLLIIKPKFPTAAHAMEMQKLIADGIPLMSIGSVESGRERVNRAIKTYKNYLPQTMAGFPIAPVNEMVRERREIEGQQYDGEGRPIRMGEGDPSEIPMPTKQQMREAYPTVKPSTPQDEIRKRGPKPKNVPQEALDEYAYSGINVAELARKYGVSPSTLMKRVTSQMRRDRRKFKHNG